MNYESRFQFRMYLNVIYRNWS